MNIAKLLCLFITPLFLLQIHPAFAYIEKDSAVVRVMDKAAGKTQALNIPVNQTKQYDGLKISVKNGKTKSKKVIEKFLKSALLW